MNLIPTFVAAAALALSTLAAAQMPSGAYLDGNDAKTAVILAHGQGLNADANVVGPLRRAIHQELGWHTLSLNMPTLSGERGGAEQLDQYAATFPDAYSRIQVAIQFLLQEKGVEHIYLMGHSMGSRMATAFLALHPEAPVAGFIGVGMLGGGQPPLNPNISLRSIKIPVLDVYAENDRDAQAAAARKNLVSERFTQVSIPGAKHDYKGYEQPVAQAVNGWLRKQSGNAMAFAAPAAKAQ